MQQFLVTGGQALKGEVTISGAKNAALPILFASLLSAKPTTISNVPKLKDIETTLKLLQLFGAQVSAEQNQVQIDAGGVNNQFAPYELVKTMRASILALGPLLSRFGQAEVSLPGGCAIGARPVNLHIDGLRKMGADIVVENGYIKARAAKLKGAHIIMDMVSVTGTENLMMAAALADGKTILENAAREPEVVDLAECLIAMGAEIEGHGTDTIRIQGKDALGGAVHKVVPDRIETGTYVMAAAITGGDVELTNTRSGLLESVFEILREAGVTIEESERSIRVSAKRGGLKGIDVMTEPFPGFPTDLQAQFMTLMSVANGASMITETIFENRFMHVPELCRMGADINVHGASAIVRGVPRLTGAQLMATDLRASVSLVLAGLAASGETVINRIYHLDRGYERLEEKLAACGADIERASE